MAGSEAAGLLVGPETAVDWVPLLAFSDFDRYYDYAAPFYPDASRPVNR